MIDISFNLIVLKFNRFTLISHFLLNANNWVTGKRLLSNHFLFTFSNNSNRCYNIMKLHDLYQSKSLISQILPNEFFLLLKWKAFNYLLLMIVAYLRLSLLVLWIEVYVFPRNVQCDRLTVNRLDLRVHQHFPVIQHRTMIVHRLALVLFESMIFLHRFWHHR